MEYQIQREGDVAVLELHGVLDVASAPTFQTALQSILDEGGNRVAVDMADVSFMTVPAWACSSPPTAV